MNAIAPEKRQLILVSDQEKLKQVLMSAMIKDTIRVQEIFNLTKQFNQTAKSLELMLKTFKDHPSSLASFLFSPNGIVNHLEPQEIILLLETIIESELQWYSLEEASKLFKFDSDSTPANGAIYYKHPFDHERYLTPSSAHAQLVDEKMFAFTELAAALGAKEIRVALDDKSSQIAEMKAIWDQIINKVGISAASRHTHTSKTEIQRKYDKPRKSPHIPGKLQTWVDADPHFRSMATERIEHGLLTQNVLFEVKEMLDLEAKVAARLVTYGFNIGGKFKKTTNTSWNFTVDFWESSEFSVRKNWWNLLAHSSS